MGTPTFEEYKAKVREVFRERYWKSLSEEEVDDYLDREENSLREWYDVGMKNVADGTAPKDYLLNAGASSAAYSLDLMY